MLAQTPYEKHRDEWLARVQKRQDDIKAWFYSIKIGQKCSAKHCDAVVTAKNVEKFDYHHKNPNFKEYGISDMMTKGYSIKSIKKELKKCILLCKECHSERHQ